jgi:hypothetical protein
MPELPPWLNFSPQTFVGAAETGRRLQQSQEQIGLEGERVGLERERFAQSVSQSAAELGLQHQRLAASERQTAMEAQIHRETILSNFNRAQTQAALTQAYHQATLGIAKSRLDQEGQKLQAATQEKALALADRQNYAMAVAGGMTPAQALAKYPRAWSPALAATSSKTPEETITRRTEIPAIAGTPAQEASRGFLGLGVKMLGAHPATAGTPDILKQNLTESVKAPRGTSPADAFRAGTAPGMPGAAPVAPATAAPGTPQTFTKGQRAEQDGVTYEFDGTNWNEVK